MWNLKQRDVLRLGAGRHSDGGNLYLLVAGKAEEGGDAPDDGEMAKGKTTHKRKPVKTSNRSWFFRYKALIQPPYPEGGKTKVKEHYLGLGSAFDVSLDVARQKAARYRAMLADGEDPVAEIRARKAARKLEKARTMTFRQAAERYSDANKDTWSNKKHAAQFLSTLKAYVFPALGDHPVADINTSDVLRVLEPIWKTKTETATRVRSRMERVFSWATVRGYRASDNPARWSGHLKEALPSPNRLKPVKHHPALPYGDLPSFMKDLRQREGVAAAALEVTILTCLRTSEVVGARHEEFDLPNAVWTVPASRMKMKKEHRVPLCGRAVELLSSLLKEEGNPFVFVGGQAGKGMSTAAMAAVLERMERNDITVHGFRSTFKDWAAEKTSYPNELSEMALAHKIANQVEAAYRRGDMFEKRRRLMEDWAAFSDGKASATILPLRA